MSWQDRPYSDDNDGRPELRIQLRRPTMLVTWIVIVNVAVHVVHLVALNFIPFERWFGLSLSGLRHLAVWQPLTYMFVHSPDGIFHLLFNMLLVYFIGRQVEQGFGSRRFLQFYLVCGLVGGLAYLALGAVNPAYYRIPLVGASGAAYGLLMAAMIFYPQMQIIFIVFPMPIRVFGGLLLALLLFQALGPNGIENLGGEICHLGGALAAVGVFYFWGIMPRVSFGMDWPGTGSGPGRLGRWFGRTGAWERKQKRLAAEQAEVDRILEKVHRDGIASLSRREKRLLADATQRQREREERAGRGY